MQKYACFFHFHLFGGGGGFLCWSLCKFCKLHSKSHSVSLCWWLLCYIVGTRNGWSSDRSYWKRWLLRARKNNCRWEFIWKVCLCDISCSLYMHTCACVHTLAHSKTCTNMSLCIHNCVSYNSLGVLGLVMGSVTWIVFVRGCMRLIWHYTLFLLIC